MAAHNRSRKGFVNMAQSFYNLKFYNLNNKISNNRRNNNRLSIIYHKFIYEIIKYLLFIILIFQISTIFLICAKAEHVRELEVSEGVPIGHQIGFIGEFLHGSSVDSGPPYLIVPVPGSGVDTDLQIDHTTGEIRTKVQLDREKRASYSFVAIPLSGENVRVIVRVLDENDNPPTFPTSVMHIEFPENTPRDVKRTLTPARDLDLGRYNTQRYNIVSGNINNAFRLSSHRERDGVLYLDLQINGFLDRETTPEYSLVIEALDGGSPPLRGQMTVNITIQDVNDNQPIFNQSRYFATIPENATIGTSVLQVYASDTDAGNNGLVEYSINRRQSDKEQMFRIDPQTGLISVNKPLDFETKEIHELVVVARDHGEQPLETTAFVSIRVTDVNDNQPIINVIFLSDDATPKISESAQPGEFVARISVNDPDSKTEYSHVNVTLSGGDGHFGLTTRDNIIYLVIVSLPLDREIQPNYTLSVIATDNGNPPLHAAKTILLRVTDINDNAPEFEKDTYHANVMEVADPGTSVIQVVAVDKDEGNNSAVTYHLLNTPKTHSQWFQIDSHTGLITTKAHIDCETEPVPQLTIIAKDSGYPQLSSTATVLVTIHDVNDNEPIFDQSFYNVSVAENEPVGRCILKVAASDPDCGVNAMVNYTFGEGIKRPTEFEVRSITGEVCITGELDYERRNSYEFPIIATDRGGLSTTAMVKIQLTDVNDNRPIFYPREYNVSLRESATSASTSTPVVAVIATDPDSGRFGAVSYRIVGGNEAGIFRIDRTTGEIFINRPNMLSSRTQPIHMLNISASDGGGLKASQDAVIFISIIDSTQRPPIFEKPRYNYYVKEDDLHGTVVGSVVATSSDPGSRGVVRYSIYSGDPDGYFNIDPTSGNVRVANPLDHETKPQVLLNIQAMSGDPPAYGHTQVNIDIEDVNDNPPEFESSTVRISVPENVELGTPLYAAHAHDKDSGKNGVVTYSLTAITSFGEIHPLLNAMTSGISSVGPKLLLDSSSGSLGKLSSSTSSSSLASPSTSSSSSSSSASHSIGNHEMESGIGTGHGTYSSTSDLFAIDSRSGHLTLSRPLDYETSQRHSLIVTATDSGIPPLSANLTILVEVQDVNDNPPVFEHNEYSIKVLESIPVNSQILQVTAIDLDTGNNARLTYRIVGGEQIISSSGSSIAGEATSNSTNNAISNNNSSKRFGNNMMLSKFVNPINANGNAGGNTNGRKSGNHDGEIADDGMAELFGIFPNSGWIYLRGTLDRETRDRYELTVKASDNGTPSAHAITRVIVQVADANDNDPQFSRKSYEFSIEENQRRGSRVGTVFATDKDLDENAEIRYNLIPSNTSFQINPITGEISTREILDRETYSQYDLVAEARDQGTPYRIARVPVKILVTDVNDNAPDIVDPQEDVVSVREEQPPGTDVVRIRAIDRDSGQNASITYSILKGRDSDGFGLFSIDPLTGFIRTKVMLDHEERSIYRLAVAATDGGTPPKQTIRLLRVEVLDLNDNRPTFTSSSLVFRVREDVPVGYVVGSVGPSDRNDAENLISGSSGVSSLVSSSSSTSLSSSINELLHITYTLTSLTNDVIEGAFDMDRKTGSLIVSRRLDRERQTEYRLEIRALDISATNNPQSSAITVKIEIADVNDNPPQWSNDPILIYASESTTIGTIIYNFTATDADSGTNGEIQYKLISSSPYSNRNIFSVDPLTGALSLQENLDYEEINEYILIIQALDQSSNITERLQTTVTARVLITDVNDNSPVFVSPVSLNRNNSSSHSNIRSNRTSNDWYNAYTGNTDGTGGNNDSGIVVILNDASQVGQLVTHVVATDKDSGDNGHITYSILSGNEDGHFKIDPETGFIELVKPILVNNNNIERIISTTTSSSSIPGNGNSNGANTGNINGNNVNSNNYRISNYNEEKKNFLHKQQGQNQEQRSEYNHPRHHHNHHHSEQHLEQFQYVHQHHSHHHQNHPRYLQIGMQEENVMNVNKFNLVISASDHGSPIPRKTNLNMKIFVQGTTSNPPRFLESVYHVNISENISSGSFVIRVGAKSFHSDASGGKLIYQIPPGVADNRFEIDNQRGIITTRGQFDREAKDYYSFPVYVTETSGNSMKMDKIGTGSKEDSFLLGSGGHFDAATVIVQITDVNDHAPEFRPGSCYPLSIPENSELSVVHTVVATDLDEGANGEIIYSIIGGNLGNKFSIDMHTGELTARPLDREQHSRYLLQIQAQDRGTPNTYQGHCNISVFVEDQNDNDPRFEQNKYVINIPEDIEVGSSVLQVHATDADLGINSRIVYSLTNETQWLFAIDNRSGVVTTVGPLDREYQSVYNFVVTATDGGKYDARSQRVPVQIIVDDVNDNKPTFDKYPFRGQVPHLVQPGQAILQVSASDPDQGINGEMLFSLVNSPTSSKFRINPNTGIVSGTQSLASENGRVLHLEVVARDKGNPPQSATGLIEIRVGELALGTPQLNFQNNTYHVRLRENSPNGHSVTQINAVRSDGRRQKITYSFVSGNEDGTFSIDAVTGEIKVYKSENLDYERYNKKTSNNIEKKDINSKGESDLSYVKSNYPQLNSKMDGVDSSEESANEIILIIIARTDGSPSLNGYCEVHVQLEDENDNAPHFTQQQYSATVWEGNHKGTFVIQVTALDDDFGSNSRVLYHIVDGNHDNAFVIEPAFSGIVKTNIVLDREIRDTYRLKIIATDEGVPQMTGTATVRVHIVDVNDNQPTFPLPAVTNISEGTDLGTVIATVSANDVDTNPALTYRFGEDDNFSKIFSIDRYSAKIVLKEKLDYELIQEYQLEVIVSDTAHEAKTTLTIRVTDENDNPPIFQQTAYYTSLPDHYDGNSNDNINANNNPNGIEFELIQVNATDIDSYENSKIRYSISPPVKGFTVNEVTGIIYVNVSHLQRPIKDDYFVKVIATDSGVPSLSSSTVVHVRSSTFSTQGRAQFLQTHYRSTINESAEIGTVILKFSQDVLEVYDGHIENLEFKIISGNDDEAFEINRESNAIMLVKKLDREKVDLYKLRIVMNEYGSPIQIDNNSTGINVFITVEDTNDNKPIFREGKYSSEISELAALRYSIAKIEAYDADQENTPNSEVIYELTSGNDEGMFTIDLVTGVLFVNNHLDYDQGANSYELIIRACDSGDVPKCTLMPYHINLLDENDNEPKFPVTEYIEFVAENEQIGTSVFTARATDLDRGHYGFINYTIEANNYSELDDSFKLFRVDPQTGLITSNAIFDYEQRSQYGFILRATDVGGKYSSVRVRILIDSRDEYTPQFTERTYRFVLATSSSSYLPIGHIIGKVLATDRDKGPDGRVVYQMSTQHTYFKVNRTTGAIMLKKKIDGGFDSGRDISLVITASSGRQGSLTNMTVVEISLDPLADPGTNLANTNNIGVSSGGIADWALGLLISLLLIIFSFAAVFLFLHVRNRRQKQITKPSLSTETVGHSNSYVDPSAFDTIPIRDSSGSAGNSAGQFAPPKYDEIPPYGGHTGSSHSGAATTSELSGSEQSGSSGRGSAEDGEDGEDEEIRMINEGPLHRGEHHRNGGGPGGPNSGEDGRISDISVQNTQEYLARLGIVDTTHNATGAASASSRRCSESMSGSNKDALLHHTLPIDSLHMFDEEPGESDITNLIYAKLNDVTGGSDRASSADEAATTAGSIGAAVDHVMGFGDVPVVGGGNPGPSMTGSLSSIVHSEEELTGSYNWDYLLDWGPQYQPLAHVFSEIARLKDDTLSVHSGNSGASSSAKSKQSLQHPAKHIPPPLLTNVAPRTINIPVLSNRNSSSHHSSGNVASNHQYLLPRSPISHDAPGGFSTSSAMSPSFSPSLSPLATRSPSISPHVVSSGVPTSHHMVSLPRHQPQPTQRKSLDPDLRVRM